MEKSVVLVTLALVVLTLIPVVPKMMSFRIAVLRKLRMNWFANLHERHYEGFVLGVRIVLAAVAAIALVAGLT